MRKNLFAISVLLLTMWGCMVNVQENPDPVTPEMLAEGFINPPDSVKPWVYWYWISDNNTREGITKDLEAMAEVGIGEALIGNIGYEGMPYGENQTLSEEWWQLIEHAIMEGKRTGVSIGLFNCPGWSQSGGPWVKPEEAMRFIVNSEIVIEGGKSIAVKLAKPADPFQDVRTLAFPQPENDQHTISSLKPAIKSFPALDHPELLADGNRDNICRFTRAGKSETITIDFEIKELFSARSISLFPAEIAFSADIEVQVPDNGKFRSVKKFRYDRSNNRVNVGPMPSGPVTYALPETSSTLFRVIMSNFSLSNYFANLGNFPSGAGLAEIEISSAPRVEQYIEKQLGKMCQTPFPLWNEYKWKTQDESGTKSMKADPSSVIDLSGRLTVDDTLKWDAPPGKWVIMRFGVTPTGTKNAQAAPQGIGFEVDKMNKDHLRKHFEAYIGNLLRRMPAEERSAWKHVVLDSYEQGSQNWTDDLIEDFHEKYEYDPVQWLPVLSGRVVGTGEQSDRFLWDLRRLVANRIAYDYVGGFRDLCQENGLRIWLENYGHWGFPSEFLMYGGQSHDVAGEFWNEGELGNIECRAASSAAHIYGKRLVSAESYTSAGLAYQRYPDMLKKRGDWSYTEGINQVILHLYIHQPYEEKNPGINAWFGTEFNRKNTWFRQSKNWIDYQRRCMFMLRRGLAVNDVCYLIGEDVPVMTGGRIPELPAGFSFDYINAEVIINRLSVKDGELVLPDGMSYKMMVLPPLETMRPELLKKIKELSDNGASIFGPPPSSSPSLKDFPKCDEEVKALTASLWDTSASENLSEKNKIIYGIDLQKALSQLNIQPDITFPEDIPLLWIHRKLKEADIYFISNQGEERIRFKAGFRVKGMQPELWDPLNGMIRNLNVYSQNENMTEIPLELETHGSAFIIFRTRTGISKNNGANFPEPVEIMSIPGPWEVRYDPKSGGPEDIITMNELEDWTLSNDEKVKYYSGTVLYKNSFTIAEIPAGSQLYLNLGKVNVMAEIRINGKSAGGLWTYPWKINITDKITSGKNNIEIEVVNNWINRLIGDSMKDEKERITWLNENPARPGDKLQPSGLLGPVTIESVRY